MNKENLELIKKIEDKLASISSLEALKEICKADKDFGLVLCTIINEMKDVKDQSKITDLIDSTYVTQQYYLEKFKNALEPSQN